MKPKTRPWRPSGGLALGREHPFTYTFSFLIHMMPLPQPCLWLRRRWSLFMTIWPRREKSKAWASLVVQGLRLYASTAGSAGLTPWSQKFHMPLDVGKKKLDLLIGQSGVWVQAEKEPQLHYSPTLGWSWKMVPREIVPVNNSSHTWCKQKCRQGWNIYGLKALAITSAMQMTPPVCQKAKRNWRASWWKWKRRVKKLALKIQHSKNEDHGK